MTSTAEPLSSAAEVAAQLGIDRDTVSAAAARLGVGRRIGSGPRAAWAFSAADVEALRNRPKPGRRWPAKHD